MSHQSRSLLPKGEMLRKAVKWISDMHIYDLSTIEEACARFNLSPLDEEFLLRHFLHADETSTKKKDS